jgi:hypothetical protein
MGKIVAQAGLRGKPKGIENAPQEKPQGQPVAARGAHFSSAFTSAAPAPK